VGSDGAAAGVCRAHSRLARAGGLAARVFLARCDADFDWDFDAAFDRATST